MAGETTQPAEIGAVPVHWDVGQLSFFTTCITYGFTNPMPTTDEGPFMLTAKDVNRGRIVYENARRTSWDAFRNKLTDKSRPRIGDVLLTKDGSIGRVAVCDRPDVCINQSVALLRPNERIAPRFLKFMLEAPHYQQRMEGDSDGTTIKHIYITRVDKMQVAVPPLAEQNAIAAVLGMLDDKIELNRRMNVALEAMARGLFQSWFVDFDPVRAKLDDRPPAGLDPATAALFPEHLEVTELGHTPNGWETRSLDRIAHYLNGLALQKYPTGDGPTLPVIKIAQLRRGDSIGADRCNAQVPPNYIVQDGDVLFSWSGSLEVELWCGGSGALNQHLFKVTSAEFPKWFYYLWTLYHLDEFRLIAADKATTMGHIQRGHLSAAKVLVPPQPLLDAMTRIMSPLIDQVIANRIQSRTLATLRDTLLPKLLSGELRVRSGLEQGVDGSEVMG